MRIDLRGLVDDKRVLRNPHKGWYWHYVDNGFKNGNYRVDHDVVGDDVRDFPGLNHLYLRLDWSDLEPAEGKFRWDVIDDILAIWGPRGYKWSLRVCNSETSHDLCFATPEWVKNAGAKGGWYGGDEHTGYWEPDYADPIFLDKLDRFLCALAMRYDGDPALELVDIGSYGNWGEGHVTRSCRLDVPVSVINYHIDLHVKYFRKTPVILNDDMAGRYCAGYNQEERHQIIEHALLRGVGLRDDSICVPSLADTVGGYDSLRYRDMYAPFAAQQVVDLELDHYAFLCIGSGEERVFKAGLPLIEAARQMKATFIGFHGYPRLFLKENQCLADYLANRAGYWFVPQTAVLPESLLRGGPSMLYMDIENRGFARAYHAYQPRLYLADETGAVELPIEWADDVRLVEPGKAMRQKLRFGTPAAVKPGRYWLEYGLYEGGRPIGLALKAHLESERGSYRIAEVNV